MTTRRSFLQRAGVAASAIGVLRRPGAAWGVEDTGRRPLMVHLSVHPVEFIENRDLGKMLVAAGVEKVWLAGYFYGQWSYDKAKLVEAKALAEAAGLKTALINVPLGHPGNSLGEVEKLVPLTIPKHWRYRIDVNGKEVRHCGCLNDASWGDNLGALREAHAMGFREVFMDDDLRLAVGPGVIGGCFCPDCLARFRKDTGASDAEVDQIREQVKSRTRGPGLLRWLRFHGGRLTAFLNACNAVAADLSVGIMVMYMGHEQAGIELESLRNRLFRVGEGMFDDRSFGTVQGKLVSLASAMFHMCYANPRLAYSETTAFPPTGLSAENMGRKLAVPLMAGVGNVMFMSGIRLVPQSYWPTLKGHIERARQIAGRLPAEAPGGGLKLWFGPGVRSVAGSWPLTDCLGMGIPVDAVTQADSRGAYLVQAEDLALLPEQVINDSGSTIVIPSGVRPPAGKCRWIESGADWPGRWRAKEAILAAIGEIPHVAGRTPAAVRWFRKAKQLLVWNINETPETMDIVHAGTTRKIQLAAGELTLIDV